MTDRPYHYFELTSGICSRCFGKVEAKIVFQGGCVFMHKRCLKHGFEKVLISTDIEYYKTSRLTLKPGQMPHKFNTPIKYGCPYDCGLCPDHEQHSCLSVVEVTDHCNLKCPVCYAESGPHRQTHRGLEQVEFMLDCVVRNEGEPDIVQISGGEPTMHPEFFAIMDAARRRPIKHLMLNTNGIRIAREAGFARRLKEYMPGFEIYLQFDSLEERPLRELRGADLRKVRQQALENLNEQNISTTLVVTVKKGLNDGELGKIVDFALTQPCVRGVTFQPVQAAGRLEGFEQAFDPARDRLTLSEVRRNILDQCDIFKPADLIPVPCHPDCLAMGYAIKIDGRAVPLTQFIDPQVLLQGEGNTIVFERNANLRDHVFRLFSTAHSPQSASMSLKQLLCCLPLVQAPEGISYDNVFRVLIVQFMDAWNLDIRSVKKSCIHIVHPDGRIIPFDTFNIFYRDEKEALLKQIRQPNGAELHELTLPVTA